MRITQLQISDLRLFADLSLRLAPGINFITGANGAGKTSLLEAMHLLGYGRSFRGGSRDTLIRHGRERLLQRQGTHLGADDDVDRQRDRGERGAVVPGVGRRGGRLAGRRLGGGRALAAGEEHAGVELLVVLRQHHHR